MSRIRVYPSPVDSMKRCRFPRCRRAPAALGDGWLVPFCATHWAEVPQETARKIASLAPMSIFDQESVRAVERLMQSVAKVKP